MSYNDDYAPRPRRDRPRFDQDAGPRYPDDDDDYADTRKSSAQRPRPEAAPPSYGHFEEPRRRKDVDPRDVEPREADKKKYREYPSERDGEGKPTKSNTAVPRRRSPNEDDDQDSGSHRYRSGDAGYGRSRGYRAPIPHEDPDAIDRDGPRGKSSTKPRRGDYDDFEPAPPRRAQTLREPERRRRDDPYDEQPPRRRHRSPEDRHSDPDRASAPRRTRDNDRYDDRRNHGASGSHARRDEGYASDKGYRRSNRGDRDRDRPYSGRERDRDVRDRDRDRDRDRRNYDSHDRNRDRDGRSKKKGFSIDDIGGLVEQGQKHYKTVAPLVSSLAKMYLDNKK